MKHKIYLPVLPAIVSLIACSRAPLSHTRCPEDVPLMRIPSAYHCGPLTILRPHRSMEGVELCHTRPDLLCMTSFSGGPMACPYCALPTHPILPPPGGGRSQAPHLHIECRTVLTFSRARQRSVKLCVQVPSLRPTARGAQTGTWREKCATGWGKKH